jgi:uncharacterized protein YbcI
MPLVILACGYGYWYAEKLLSTSLSEFSHVETSIEKIEFKKRSNNKAVETIYTDLLITTATGLKLHKKNISTYTNQQLVNKLTRNELVDIFYEKDSGIIKDLRKNREPLISFQSELKKHRKGRIAILVFFFGFLFWYLYRMYKYRKYGFI